MTAEASIPNAPFQLGDIPADKKLQEKRGWALSINGNEYTDPVTSATLVSEKMGLEWRYGQHPVGYDVWNFHEPGGGGSVIVPTLVSPEDGTIYVGVVGQKRPNINAQGEPVWEVPRGFLDLGETHDEGAGRELREETGLQASQLTLLARGINPNSTFFNTSGVAPDGGPEGVRIYGLQIRPSQVVRVEDPEGVHYEFTEELRESAKGHKAIEGILSTPLVPISKALESRDGFTQSAIGAMLGHLVGEGILRLAEVRREVVEPVKKAPTTIWGLLGGLAREMSMYPKDIAHVARIIREERVQEGRPYPRGAGILRSTPRAAGRLLLQGTLDLGGLVQTIVNFKPTKPVRRPI